ncbi:MAG TPA: CGNR zinc finger domain-containing protein [Terracidiphilus sp.]|nr:CGNR zinc finger domain-containing protein [Terracidiphilus sp.]
MQTKRQKRVFELVAGNAALDLVNTLDWRFRASGTEELLTSYDDLLDFAEQAGLLAARQVKQLRRDEDSTARRAVEQARELREALADLVYAGLDGRDASSASMRTMEKFLQSARAQARLMREGRRLRWDWAGGETKPEFPVWLLTRAASRLMLSEDVERVRACDDPECRWLFVDTSKNHTRRWCDMKICGNRMKARRFKALHAAD